MNSNTNTTLQSKLEGIRQSFALPGMAVVVLQDGEVVFREGFGLRDVERNLPFTPETMALVASTTKSITAGLIGILVDEGILDWTRQVREYWTEFKMMDEFASREMTLEDMLCHRSGLPSHENLLAHGVGRDLSGPDFPDRAREWRLELLKRLAHFEPASPFRTQFEYQDVIVTCAGAIVEQVTGEDYETLVCERILKPLGMNSSTFARADALTSAQLAQGYAVVDGQVTTTEHCDTRYLAPTAGLYSSADDMARWLQLQLNNGKVNNGRSGEQQLISTDSMDWIRSTHMIGADAHPYYGGGALNYAQGWMVHSLRGQRTLSHPGSFNGYRTNMSYIPEHNIGVVVLSNLNLSCGMLAASLMALDHLLGFDEPQRWVNHYQVFEAALAADETQALKDFNAARDLSQPASHELEAYTGSFQHPGYGTFHISLEKGVLQQRYDDRSYPLEVYKGDTFASRFQSTENHLEHITLSFESDVTGEVVAVRIPIVPGIALPRFSRATAIGESRPPCDSLPAGYR